MSVHGSVCQAPGTAEDLAAVKLEQVTQEQSGSSGLPCSNGHSGPLLQSWSCSWFCALSSRKGAMLQRGSSQKYSSNVDETTNDKGNNAAAKRVLEMSPNTQS